MVNVQEHSYMEKEVIGIFINQKSEKLQVLTKIWTTIWNVCLH